MRTAFDGVRRGAGDGRCELGDELELSSWSGRVARRMARDQSEEE